MFQTIQFYLITNDARYLRIIKPKQIAWKNVHCILKVVCVKSRPALFGIHDTDETDDYEMTRLLFSMFHANCFAACLTIPHYSLEFRQQY